MNKIDIIKIILEDKYQQPPQNNTATVFAPSNIALCKYWGKRNQELNLPNTSSLSISLGDLGANTTITINKISDEYYLNNKQQDSNTAFSIRLKQYLDLFRNINSDVFFKIETELNIPMAAGVASSACGFAALVLALNKFYGWELTDDKLSILARLGSGSASRSLWQGFVVWQRGEREDGMDSYASPLPVTWPELQVKLLMLDNSTKALSSRDAMQRTVATCKLYGAWDSQVTSDIIEIKNHLTTKDFCKFGKIIENNALAMHATMLSSWPPILYSTEQTITAMRKVWQLRADGVNVFFTQDAGPNLKLLFLDDSADAVLEKFQLK